MTEPVTSLAPGEAALARKERRLGVIYALSAFGLWALNPLFFKLLAHVNPFEVIVHRAFWSVPVGLAITFYLGRTGDIKRVFQTPGLLARMSVSALLISGNWVLFVWAVAAGLTLQASLGYFINPLLNVLIGFLLLGERLTRPQMFAVALVAIAVAIQTIGAGVFPWVAVSLAVMFALYGYIRKTADIGPVQGFVAETIIMLPASLALAWWFAASGNMQFTASWSNAVLLIACGPVTAAPLIFFASGARRLRYSTIGILQYIAPSGMFVIAVFIFHEPVGVWKLASFALIWLALIIYTTDAMARDRSR
ncbi:MAG TPA: EamA family transporter RarD [Rhizobiales bacterium]|nr:EamA family transporter RarD [Hyphomicrobiales bacterium]